MFERYTEKARRVIFFARYEASSFGSPYIESEHLLLGLLRDSKEIVRRYMDAQATVSDIRSVIESASIRRDPTSTSVDLPLSKECKRILAYSSEEAERLGHKHIGTEHLMLGILRETGCLAARLLGERGVQVDRARLQVAEYSKTWPSETGVPAPPAKRHFRGFRVAERAVRNRFWFARNSVGSRAPETWCAFGKMAAPCSLTACRMLSGSSPATRGSVLTDLEVIVVKEETPGDAGS